MNTAPFSTKLTPFFLPLFLLLLTQLSYAQDTEPYIESMARINAIDRDNDGYYEQWSILVNVDPIYQDRTSEDVVIEVYEPNFHPGGTGDLYGPVDFTDYDESDAVEFGPYITDGSMGLPAQLEFRITATNDIAAAEDYFYIQAEYIANERPVISSVSLVNTVDSDNDNWYEQFSFEFDIDPEAGGFSDDVSISISADGGNFSQTSTGHNFAGSSSGDNVIVGPFNQDQFSSGPQIYYFEFTVQNSAGSFSDAMDVEVDGDDYGPEISSIDVVSSMDQDQDAYLESWYLEVDMEEISGGDLEQASLELRYNGSLLDSYGPQDFMAGSTGDNVSFGPLSYMDFQQGKGSYTFTIWAENFYGSVTGDIDVQVDDVLEQNVAPDIVSLALTRTRDDNQDGSYEEFYLAVDVDPLQGDLSLDVYLEIDADQVTQSPTYGPYRIDDSHASGQFEFGPFTFEQFSQLPREIPFVIRAYNLVGNDSRSLNVDMDDGAPLGEAPVASFSADLTSGLAPLSVQFTDESLNDPSSWAWEFAGGSPATSSEQNPSVEYMSAGTFAVKLTATNAYGSDASTVSGFITVTAPVLSTDASLASLELSSGVLQPSFLPTIFEYRVDLPVGTTAPPEISGSANSSEASLSISPPADIFSDQSAQRTATIEVTAEDVAVKQEYQIEFNVIYSTLHTLTFTESSAANLEAMAGADSTVQAGELLQLGSEIMALGGVPPYSILWIDAQGLSLSGDRPTVQVASTTAYTLLVTDATGCVASDQMMVHVNTLSNEERGLDRELTIYPNPAKDFILIQFKKATASKVRFELFDARSALVNIEEVHTTEGRYRLELNGVKSGIYILRIKIDESYITKRIIINHRL
jgi:PKD repeat protein